MGSRVRPVNFESCLPFADHVALGNLLTSVGSDSKWGKIGGFKPEITVTFKSGFFDCLKGKEGFSAPGESRRRLGPGCGCGGGTVGRFKRSLIGFVDEQVVKDDSGFWLMLQITDREWTNFICLLFFIVFSVVHAKSIYIYAI